MVEGVEDIEERVRCTCAKDKLTIKILHSPHQISMIVVRIALECMRYRAMTSIAARWIVKSFPCLYCDCLAALLDKLTSVDVNGEKARRTPQLGACFSLHFLAPIENHRLASINQKTNKIEREIQSTSTVLLLLLLGCRAISTGGRTVCIPGRAPMLIPTSMSTQADRAAPAVRIHLRATSQRALLEGEGDTHRRSECASCRFSCDGEWLSSTPLRSCMLYKKQQQDT